MSLTRITRVRFHRISLSSYSTLFRSQQKPGDEFERAVHRRHGRTTARAVPLGRRYPPVAPLGASSGATGGYRRPNGTATSEEDTTELQSRLHHICPRLLEKQ